MSEHPIYDELRDKWDYTDHYRAICDEHWTVTHPATGQVWYEDDEGNEVFPEPTYAYLAPQDVKVGDVVTPIKLGEPQYAEGGIVTKVDPKLPVKIVNGYIELDESRNKPKRKFKLLGRNQGTNGTL